MHVMAGVCENLCAHIRAHIVAIAIVIVFMKSHKVNHQHSLFYFSFSYTFFAHDVPLSESMFTMLKSSTPRVFFGGAG
jgi:hypothetical protein